jgi:ATP-dependent DNA helicase RecG
MNIAWKHKVILYNDGRLPEGWTISDLLTTHRSEPYNPMIANVFFRCGLIETWGRGIEKITTACKDAGKPAPVFEFKHGRQFSVTFFTDGTIGEGIGEGIGENEIIGETAAAQGETKLRILTLMREDPNISAKEVAKKIGIALRNVEAHIKSLKEADFIAREGAARGGRWVVKK